MAVLSEPSTSIADRGPVYSHHALTASPRLVGRERSKTFERRSDAERWVSVMEVSKARGEWVDPALGRCTFATWAEEWAATVVDLRPSTRDRDLRAVRVHLVPCFGDVPLAKMTNPMVKRFIADMLATGDHAPSTVRKVGQVLAKVMRSAVDAGLIVRSPDLGAGDGRARPRWPPLPRPSPHRCRVGDQPGCASQGAPRAHGPQLGDRDARSVRARYEGLDGQIAEGLDDLLRGSRGLLAASGASRPGSGDPS